MRGDVYGLEEDFGCLPPSLPAYGFVAGLLPDLGLPFSLHFPANPRDLPDSYSLGVGLQGMRIA